MGNCASKVDCEACFSGKCNVKIEADNDIVGIGVLISFFLSAVLTIGATLYGYFCNALPLWYLNEADAAILDGCHKSWLTNLCRHIVGGLGSVIGQREGSTRIKLTREQRVEGLSRFVLSLSDQQLVTGLAILISAFSSRCTISMYEFKTVAALAWFSSTTHLATLDILQEYFMRHKVVRNIRIVGMVILMAILVIASILSGDPKRPDGKPSTSQDQQWYHDMLSTSAQCANPEADLALALYLLPFLLISYWSRIRRISQQKVVQRRQIRVSYFLYRDYTNVDNNSSIDQMIKEAGVFRFYLLFKLVIKASYLSFAFTALAFYLVWRTELRHYQI